jgi:hypothetical protein
MNCKKPIGDSGNPPVNNFISAFFNDNKTKKLKKLVVLSYALL